MLQNLKMHKLEESQHEIDVFEALLERSSPNVAWGLTMGGEGTPSNPLHIAQVQRVCVRACVCSKSDVSVVYITVT